MTVNLPHLYDIDIIITTACGNGCNYNKNKSVSALNRFGILFNLNPNTQLTVQTLDNIDKWIVTFNASKVGIDGNTYKYDRDNCMIFKKLIECSFGYKFPLSTQSRKIVSDIPPEINKMLIQQPNMTKFVDKFIAYVKINIKSENTYKGYIAYLRYCLFPLENNIISNTLIRDHLIKLIQDIEDSSSDTVKTKDLTKISQSLSNPSRKAIFVCNCMIKAQITESIKDAQLIKELEICPKIKNITTIDRDYFTDEELNKIVDAYDNDRDKLIFTILLSVGLRIGGLLNLKVKSVYDINLNVLQEGQTIEKGNKVRKFPIFPAMRQALELYKASNFGSVLSDPEYALFPARNKGSGNFKGSKISCGQTTIRRIIKKVCDKAGVRGDHVHTHAFRKTVVVKLMSDGNTLDNVAKFIGHSSSAITAKHYWTPTQEDLLKNMNISWMLTNRGADGELSESSINTIELQKITSALMEGFTAKRRLEHVMNVLNDVQRIEIESKWTQKDNEDVAEDTRKLISQIMNIAGTVTSLSSSLIS